ncbi:MAG: PEP-CTERM sorting domain-containing protein [Phycisphaerales bacterium]|nr:PEP-CTERM sorting domain-containing protein [Phycisphaerales bacterium]
MKRFVALAAGLALFVVPANAALRLFFSTGGAFSNSVVNDVGVAAGDMPAANGGPGNPTVGNGTILYLWAQMIGPPSSQKWNGVSFDVHVDGGVVADRLMYNYTVVDPDFGDVLYTRWQGVNQGVGVGTADLTGINLAAVTSGEGINNGVNAATYDDQSEIGPVNAGTAAQRRALPKSVLLGWVQVQATGPVASVFLRVGTGGISRAGATGAEPVYLGAGDEDAGLRGNSFGSQSPMADATVTPEPASLALLGLAALAMRRR